MAGFVNRLPLSFKFRVVPGVVFASSLPPSSNLQKPAIQMARFRAAPLLGFRLLFSLLERHEDARLKKRAATPAILEELRGCIICNIHEYI